MSPYDAVFLALAVGLFLGRPRWRWLVALAPFVAIAAGYASLGDFEKPVAAVLVCMLSPRFAPAAILLAIPVYPDLVSGLSTAVLWLAATAILAGLDDRFDDEILPKPMRGVGVRLLTVGIFYYTFMPVLFL